MSERLIAIGDIHGCKTALECLLDSIHPTPEDTIVTLGDYVDRGPDSRGVIDRLIRLGGETRHLGLMGNHEEMMLEVVRHQAAHDSWFASRRRGYTGQLWVWREPRFPAGLTCRVL